MSTFESFVTNCSLDSDQSFLRGMAHQNNKIETFLKEHRRRVEIVEALKEQNMIMSKQIQALRELNAAKAKQVSKDLDQGQFELNKSREEHSLLLLQVAKHRELIRQLEISNSHLRKQSASNEILIQEAKDRIDLQRLETERVQKSTELVEDEISAVKKSGGDVQAVNLAIGRSIDGFEELSSEVDRLREENCCLLNRVAECQANKDQTERAISVTKESHLASEEDHLSRAVGIRDEVEAVKAMGQTQEKLIETIQIDLETLREENAYLTERVKKRGLGLD